MKYRGLAAWIGALVMSVAFVGGCGGDDTGSGSGTADECSVGTDCTGANEVCEDGQCVVQEPECSVDTDCPDGEVCDDQGNCEAQTPECVEDADCPGENMVCTNGTCEAQAGECTSDSDCVVAAAPYCEGVDMVSEAAFCADDNTCQVEESRTSCEFGCELGACKTDPCAELTAEEAEPVCVDNVGEVYADTGQCTTNDDGEYVCWCPLTFNNCDYTGATCNPDTGLCDGGVTQTGGVVIVEFMAQPTEIFWLPGQWFEIVNTSGQPIDLTGWTLESGEGDQVESHTLTENIPNFPDGARLLFASGDDPADDGSVTPDYNYDGIQLGRVSDFLQIKDADGNIVDRIFWEAGTIVEGHSRKLSPDAEQTAAANDDFANWCPELGEGYSQFDNFGTPGATNPSCAADACANWTCTRPADYCNADGDAVQYQNDDAVCETSRFNNPFCDYEPQTVDCTDLDLCVQGACEPIPGTLPAAGEVIFTEFMGNPTIVADDEAEWFELYNLTDEDRTLFSLTVNDGETGGSADAFTVTDPTAYIPANGWTVFVRSTDDTVNGGISERLDTQGNVVATVYAYDGGHLKNSPASPLTMSLVRQDDTVVDSAPYEAPNASTSQQLDAATIDLGTDPAADNDDLANWCGAARMYSTPNMGTPGEPNRTCGGI